MAIRSGSMRRQMVLEVFQESIDNRGNPVRDAVEHSRPWVQLIPARGPQEKLSDGKIVEEERGEVVFRFRDGISGKARLTAIDSGEIYELFGLADPDMRRRELRGTYAKRVGRNG